ncbi:MAG: primosomal protein N' [Bacteroidales bacterium]|nr:primosomal protein N' [Bacteroidales bacterium]
MAQGSKTYLEVIVPLKFCGGITYYSVPEGIEAAVAPGSWVVVTMVGKRYLAVVRKAGCPLPAGLNAAKVLPIEKVAALPPLPAAQLDLWQAVADYYLCSLGEVFKSAYPAAFFRQTEKKRTVNRPAKEVKIEEEKTLSDDQAAALEQIRALFAGGRHTVLLDGATSSGKTEIYIKLAREHLAAGRSVLYLVPEIAMSRQLEMRIRAAVGDKLLVFHSKQTAPARKKIFDTLVAGEGNYLVLGTRSALFLPIVNLGFIIVDEEHDASYKQDDPAPRYNGRDVALMMAARLGIDTLMGSATPSLESLYNAAAGKYGLVKLDKKYFGAADAPVTIIDMGKVYRMHNARGSFSMQLVNMIDARLKAGQQVMVFRSRRSYSSFLQCSECGDTLRCPHCNVSLTYHKYNNTVSCHYCGYKAPFEAACTTCGAGEYTARGTGTEKLAEELQELFPQARIDRLDTETAASITAEKKILGDFAGGATDILVGTQMITKGFDFEKLALVAVINADSILSLQDFRADEKALQLLLQLRGRASRREGTGAMAIQTMQPDHPVLKAVCDSSPGSRAGFRGQMLEQRKVFGFPPYVRLVQLTVKNASAEELRRVCNSLERALKQASVSDFTPPVAPAVDRVADQYIRHIWVKPPRAARAQSQKKGIVKAVESILAMSRSTDIIIDVDPL